MRENDVTAEYIRQALHYNPETGVFRWRRSSRRVKAGTIAGTIDPKGYRLIHLIARKFRAHRIAFAYMTGEWPTEQVDHRNLDKDDNRWQNLRQATNGQNQSNQAIRRNNTSGYKGVSWFRRDGKWRATIDVGGRSCHLGYFSTAEEAHAAYVAKAVEYRGDFARGA